MAMDESALGAVPILPSVRPFPRPLAEAAVRVSNGLSTVTALPPGPPLPPLPTLPTR
jgi:hypothetical protein